ncbi:LicD family protein [Odoribacter sp. OttesenSCG-928-J03]|nr:LicD family protein [Odoribacter sp. OttesenSCG-928-J03]
MNKIEEDFSDYNGDGTTLRKAQLRLLDMLVAIDQICRKHHIPYWLDFGTLLGAVRHKGFIPWDDDLDIAIHRKDYRRLRKYLIKELPENYFYSDWTTDKYHFDDYGRVKDKNSSFPYPMFRKQKVQGLSLDIFTISEVPSAGLRTLVNFFYKRVFREVHRYGAVAYKSSLRRVLNIMIAYLLFPFVYLMKYINRFLAIFRIRKIVSYDYFTKTYTHSKKDIFPLQEIEFEGKQFFVPFNTDAYLRDLYGDNYMQPPPMEKRTFHVSLLEVYD